MSQVAPSSSHQLVAAAVAFRNARRVFPVDFGCGQARDSKLGNRHRRHNRCSSISQPVKDQRNGDSSREWTTENSPTSKAVCKCCQSHDTSLADSKLVNSSNNDHYNSGDVERCSKERRQHNDQKKDTVENVSEDTMCKCSRHCCAREKRAESLPDAPADIVHCHGSPRNGIYDDAVDNFGDQNLRGKAQQTNDFQKTIKDWEDRHCDPPWMKLKRRTSRKDMSRTSSAFTSENHSTKYQNLDLLRPSTNTCDRDHRLQSRNCKDCRCQCYPESSKGCCPSKDDLKNVLDNWSRPLSSKSRQKSSTCCKLRTRSKQSFSPSCCSKDSGIISTLHERDDEDEDEANALERKDSISILAEKYNLGAREDGKKYSEKVELTDNENREECKSLVSDFNEDEKSDDACPCRERNRRSLLKTCKIGYNQAQRENELARLRELRSRLINAGLRCSTKDANWRQAF